MKLSRILVPVDFLACSEKALATARELAAAMGGEITALAVWQPPEFAGADLMVLAHSENLSIGDYGRQHTERELEAFAPDLRREVRMGEPRQVILERAADFDLIVMGTHGKTGASRLLLGSVAEAVVRRAACPVLTVHA